MLKTAALKPSRIAILLLATLLTGCPLTDDYGKAVDEFQKSSEQLTTAYRSLLDGANQIEQDSFIDLQVFTAQPLDPASIQAHALLTPDQIKLRIAAIQALADYTAALATLAEGKPAAEIQANSAKASKSAADLTQQVANVGPSATPADLSGPISSAVTGIGDFLAFVEKRRGEAEVKESLRKNDPQLAALFKILADESTSLCARRKATHGLTGIILFRSYDVLRRGPSTPTISVHIDMPGASGTASSVTPTPHEGTVNFELLQLSDRIKQYDRDTVLLAAGDPTPAFLAFKDAHDKLIAAVLAPKDQKQRSLAELFASVKAFANQVAALA